MKNEYGMEKKKMLFTGHLPLENTDFALLVKKLENQF